MKPSLETPQRTLQRQESLLLKLLKMYNLTQHTTKLADMGYEDNIVRFGLMSFREREELFGHLKLLPG